jgi:hypothetical protein
MGCVGSIPTRASKVFPAKYCGSMSNYHPPMVSTQPWGCECNADLSTAIRARRYEGGVSFRLGTIHPETCPKVLRYSTGRVLDGQMEFINPIAPFTPSLGHTPTVLRFRFRRRGFIAS